MSRRGKKKIEIQQNQAPQLPTQQQIQELANRIRRLPDIELVGLLEKAEAYHFSQLAELRKLRQVPQIEVKQEVETDG